MTAVSTPTKSRRSSKRETDDSGVHARRWFTPYLLIAPGALWLLIFFIIPLFSLGRLSLSSGGLSNYSTVISDNSTVIVRTFVYASIATLSAIAIGYPLAYVIATKGGRFKNMLLALVVLPFFVTYLVRTLSWKILLFDGGPVVSILHSVGVLNENQGILGSPFAVVAALTYNFLPFMVLPIYVSLEKMDRRLLEAAADLYSSPARAFRRVTLPLSLPGIVAGALLVFIPASGEFVIPDLLGGPDTPMIGRVLWLEFFQNRDWPMACALATALGALLAAPLLLFDRLRLRAG
jgi:spermidine/putrescine transport system permease protein